MDKMWVQHYDTETEEQSKQSKHCVSQRPKNSVLKNRFARSSFLFTGIKMGQFWSFIWNVVKILHQHSILSCLLNYVRKKLWEAAVEDLPKVCSLCKITPCLQVDDCTEKESWNWFWFGWPPILFSWFSTVRLLVVPKTQKIFEG